MFNKNCKEKTDKTRDLSTYDFLEALQIEYVVAQLRRKIYPKAKDKNYFTRVMDFKKRKIDDIVSRNKYVPTLFTDSTVKETIYNKVYGEFGFPNFFYKDEAVRAEMEEKDVRYYYMKDVEVKFLTEGNDVLVGTLYSVSPDLLSALIKVEGERVTRKIPTRNIARIL